MPELSLEQISAFQQVLESLRDSFALSLSENFNQMFTLEAGTYTQLPLSAFMNDQELAYQVAFSFPTVSPDESLMAFNVDDAKVLVDLASGGDGKNPANEFAGDDMETLSAAMSGTVQGLSIAIGNLLNKVVQTGGCSCSLEVLALPPAFATSDTAVKVEVPFNIMDVLDGTLRMYFTQDVITSIAPYEEPSEPVEVFTFESTPGFGGSFAPSAGQTHFAPSAAPASAPAPTFAPPPAPTTIEVLPKGMDLIMDIPLDVSVELGRKMMLIKDVLDLSAGSIVELERVAGEPVDLMVNGRLIAKGEVVVIDDNFGLRITEIVSPADRLNELGRKG